MADSDPNYVDMNINEKLVQALNRLARATRKTPESRYTEFMKFRPPVFKGAEEYSKVDFWIAQLEKIFDVFRKPIPSHEKVKLAMFLFEGDALDWWNTVKDRDFDYDDLSWREFRKIFYEKYLTQ